MRYTVTTFKVRLEVCDVGERTGASEDAVRVARPVFAELDADKEHFLLLALNNKNRINGYKVISTGTLTATLIRPATCTLRRLILGQQPLFSSTIIRPATQCQARRIKKLRDASKSAVRCSQSGCSITSFWALIATTAFRTGGSYELQVCEDARVNSLNPLQGRCWKLF
jgi:hypothetical protein